MIRAILDGRKTQTRRIIKPQPYANGNIFDGREIICHCDALPPSTMLLDVGSGSNLYTTSDAEGWERECPYGQPGDRLWVRETFAEAELADGTPVVTYRAGGCIAIGRKEADGPDYLLHEYAWPETPEPPRWRPAIYMPRLASRITLDVVSVRVERLQDISEADALAEGVDPQGPIGYISSAQEMGLARYQYANLWESIHGPGAWEENPWVWVVEFRRIEQVERIAQERMA